MPSKRVVDRQKKAIAVSATVDAYRDRLRAGLREALVPMLPDPEAVIDAATLLADTASQLLVHRTDHMVTTDEAHALELTDDGRLRTERNQATSELREHLVALRDALTGLYEPETPALVGMPGQTPTDPVALVRYAREAARGLQENPLPRPRFVRVSIDRAAEAKALEEEARRLEATIQAVADDVRENEETKTARDEARDAFDHTFSTAAGLLSALYAFAGEAELADRVRPSARSARLSSSETTTDAEEPPPAVSAPA